MPVKTEAKKLLSTSAFSSSAVASSPVLSWPGEKELVDGVFSNSFRDAVDCNSQVKDLS